MAGPEIRIVAQQAGRPQAKEITPLENSAQWATAAVGGFADASFSLPGRPETWRKTLPFLSLIQISYGDVVVWEGQVEDLRLVIQNGDAHTEVQAFGLQRLLSETSVRRIWSKRDISWFQTPGGIGAAMFNSDTKGDVTLSVGRFDPTDLSKTGFRVAGNGVSVATNAGTTILYGLQSGMSIVCILGTLAGSFWGVSVGASADGTNGSWSVTGIGAAGDFNIAVGNRYVGIAAVNQLGATTVAATSLIDLYNLRILGTSVSEDATGGFYGGTILADLIGLVPGLHAGLIESGSDYTIQAVERAVRDTALSVVQEVASYYTREWGVWESGRFDWKSLQPDPEWIIPISDCISLTLDGSLDGIARTSYVLYTDAASGLDAEASATSSEQTNPYFKQGRTKDVLVTPGFPMTSSTSAQLASIVNGETSKYVPVTGQVVLSAKQMVRSAKGGLQPAYLIRGGDDVVLPDLPRDDLFQPQGRDMQTLFHVASTDVSLPDQTVTLQLQGQTKSSDVLLARLAATTRVLTG